MKKVLHITLFALLFFVVQSSAQTVGTPAISTNPLGWGMNNLFYSNRVFNSMIANQMLTKGAKNGKRRAANSSAPKANKAAINYSAFRETPGILLAKMVTEKNGGKNQREIEQMFSQFVGLYKQTAKNDGFPANDLAYAFEYFIVNNYQLHYNLITLPTEKDPYLKNAKDGFDRIALAGKKRSLQIQIYQERALYDQLKELFAANAEIQKMTDAQKQEATELLAVMFGVNFAGYMKGVNDGDDKLIEQARQMAKEGLEKLLGASVDKIKLTGNGLEL